MPIKSPEDILQSIYDAALKAIRTTATQDQMLSYLLGGAREHREQEAVSTSYTPASNSISFTSARRHIRIYCDEDMYWVDSATDDTDAGDKLTTANQRGFIKRGDKLELSFATGIVRLDFLAVDVAGAVYVTGLE